MLSVQGRGVKGEGRQTTGGRRLFAVVCLGLLLALTYSNSFDCSWHLDDFPNILDNPNVHLQDLSWSSLKQTMHGRGDSLHRPFSFLTLGLNYYFGKEEVFGYHLVNFIIHLMTALLLYGFLVRVQALIFMGAPPAERHGQRAHEVALLATLIWALHPVQVTAVTYIVQRMASLAALFHLGAMSAYLKARTSRGVGKQALLFAVTVCAAGLAFTTKENTLMLPANLFLVEVLLIQGAGGRGGSRQFWRYGLFLGLGLLAAGVLVRSPTDILLAYEERPFSLTERLLTQPRVIFYYLSLLFYPIDQRLALLHDFQWSVSLVQPWTTGPALAALLLGPVLALRAGRRFPLAVFALLFFLVNHLIEGSVIALEMVFEHRNYLPSMFLFLPVAMLILRALDYFSYRPGLQWVIVTVVALVVTSMAHTSYSRNHILKNDLSLWRDNSRKFPLLTRPHGDLGVAYFEAGLYDLALEETAKGLEARRTDRLDDFNKIVFNLGQIHLAMGHYEQARPWLLRSLSLDPAKSEAYVALAKIMLHEKKFAQAEILTRRGLEFSATSAEYYYIRAMALIGLGRTQEALAAARRSLRLAPEVKLPLYVMGEAWRQQGDLGAASRYFEEFLRNFPDNIDARLALIELSHLQGMEARQDRLVFQVLGMAGERGVEPVLGLYDATINLLGSARVETIRDSFRETFARSAKKIESVKKK